MLTFEQKLAIADSYPELERRSVSLGRVNYHYEQSAYDKKIVLYHLHPNGNGFVYVGEAPEGSAYKPDDKGFVNIRDFAEEELRSLIARAIRQLSRPAGGALAEAEPGSEETWVNAANQKLALKFEEEDGMWYVFAGLNLDAAFESYEEAKAYLAEEGFART
ncbi:hypothetical protein COLU111180_07060 [Cohnella lubricantis]|uniref:Uncharacterized protein n=1 Tax=Cohnella lubricantis TaxID=2163172 RepID=A0A841TJA9_9BACL|nr:hypothetical protein [Cohnella lubricantis]MBB6678591.1 hypothetical protein [Cohnella lubricantis]MBP2119099.1 hypothetical protein [Cohnella lubricantis]